MSYDDDFDDDEFNPYSDRDFSESWITPNDQETYEDSEGRFVSLLELINSVGYETLGDVTISLDDINPKDLGGLRGVRFGSIGEAVVYLYDAGILSFSNVVVYDDGTYGALLYASN